MIYASQFMFHNCQTASTGDFVRNTFLFLCCNLEAVKISLISLNVQVSVHLRRGLMLRYLETKCECSNLNSDQI